MRSGRDGEPPREAVDNGLRRRRQCESQRLDALGFIPARRLLGSSEKALLKPVTAGFRMSFRLGNKGMTSVETAARVSAAYEELEKLIVEHEAEIRSDFDWFFECLGWKAPCKLDSVELPLRDAIRELESMWIESAGPALLLAKASGKDLEIELKDRCRRLDGIFKAVEKAVRYHRSSQSVNRS